MPRRYRRAPSGLRAVRRLQPARLTARLSPFRGGRSAHRQRCRRRAVTFSRSTRTERACGARAFFPRARGGAGLNPLCLTLPADSSQCRPELSSGGLSPYVIGIRSAHLARCRRAARGTSPTPTSTREGCVCRRSSGHLFACVQGKACPTCPIQIGIHIGWPEGCPLSLAGSQNIHYQRPPGDLDCGRKTQGCGTQRCSTML